MKGKKRKSQRTQRARIAGKRGEVEEHGKSAGDRNDGSVVAVEQNDEARGPGEPVFTFQNANTMRGPISPEDLRQAGLPAEVYPYDLRCEDGQLYLGSYSNSTATVNSFALKVFDDDVALARRYCRMKNGIITVEQVFKSFPRLTFAPGDKSEEKAKWVEREIIEKRDDSDLREASVQLYDKNIHSVPELSKYRPSQIDNRRPHTIQAELADRLYGNLKMLRYATQIKYKSEKTLREEHPEMIDFWRAVDSVDAGTREDFFRGRIHGKDKAQLFEFIAKLLGERSAATVYDHWKKYRPK